MSKWTDNFHSHALVGVWANLLEVINDENLIAEASESVVEDIARLRKAIAYLNGIFENIDPEITPYNHLASIQKSAQNCLQELNAFSGNKNVGHLTNANTQADLLLVQFQQLPASALAYSNENIKESVSAYSETIGSFITKYREETEASVSALSERVKNLESEIEDKENKLNKLNNQIEIVAHTIQAQTTEFNTQYQASESSRVTKFEKELASFENKTNKNIESYSEKSDKEFKTLAIKAAKIIEVLTELQDNASKVYGVTINTLQGGAYSSYANEESKIANIYRRLASALMIIGASFLIVPEIIQIVNNDDYNLDWLRVLGRVPMSLVVFVPAFYFARESGKHRNNEVTNRRRQHILTTLDPYIELMDDDKAEELKMLVAKTIFSEATVSQPSNDETGNIISQLANLAKQLRND